MKKNLISIDITLGKYQTFVDSIIAFAQNKTSSYVCVANVHMLVEAYKDTAFAAIVNNADIVTPDGMPLAKGLKILYNIQQDRVAGMDLLPDLLVEAQSKQLPVFFYGGTDEMLQSTQAYLLTHYPNLKDVHFYAPPFRQLTSQEEQTIIAQINESGAGLVFVVLGCPKQEKWMSQMKGKIRACMIGIGGALPVMIGMQSRAPKWMQEYSLEWLFRLSQEPKRLFKRYLITNSIFIGLMLKAKAKNIFK